jgi:predicted transglutaminase-like protease
MNLSKDITVSDFYVLLFKIETTASLSEKNMTFLFLNSWPHKNIAKAIGINSR